MNKKICSRKFWIAVSQILAGLLIIFNFSDNTATLVSGAVVSLSSAIIYIVTEGKIDAASVSKAAADTEAAIDVLKADPVIAERLKQLKEN